jgi:ATP-binding cassette subfamily B protein
MPSRIVSFLDTLSNFIGNILSIGAIITLLILLDPLMLLISTASIIINLLINPVLGKIGYQSYLERTHNERIQSYVKRVFYIVDYIKELKFYPVKDLLLQRYDESNSGLINTITKFSTKNIFFIILMSILNILSFAVILIYIAYKALKGIFSIGDVGGLYNATEQFKSTAISFFQILPSFIENSLYVDNYLSFMSTRSIIEEKNIGMPVDSINSIRFDNVSFSYTDRAEKLALNGITLTISNNQKIALIGHNGAGKSTLVNLLTRLYDPLAGTIYLNNKDYKDYKISELRDSFLIIFQDSQKYAVSIAENILMREVRTRDDEIAVMEALRKVDLYDKVRSFKNGIHSILTKEFDNEGIVLSGGETQKLIAARVLTSRARVIVLDEITSNMDAMAEHEIFERVIEYARDKMVLYISHRLSMSKSADKIYVIEDGRIIEQGTHKELMNVASKYRDMFMVQAEKYGEG